MSGNGARTRAPIAPIVARIIDGARQLMKLCRSISRPPCAVQQFNSSTVQGADGTLNACTFEPNLELRGQGCISIRSCGPTYAG